MNRREWATTLGAICSPSFPAQAVEAIVDMLPLLAEYSDAMFTIETVKAVASAKRRQSTPSYDEIVACFARIWRDNLPAKERLGANPEALRIAEATRMPMGPQECADIDKQVADLKREFAARPVASTKSEKPNPMYLSKLQLAQSAPPEVLAGRPDLRAALAAVEAGQ